MIPPGILTALRTLTVFPVPGRDPGRPADALSWFPAVGCILGLFLHGLGLLVLFFSGGWHAGAAAAMVAGSVAATGCLHLDGLADWADAFGGGGDAGRILHVMKDPRIGVFGAAAVFLVLLCKWAAFTRLLEEGTVGVVVPVYVIARIVMVDLAVRLPYARGEGGTGEPFVSGALPSHRLRAAGGGVVLAFLFGGFFGLVLAGCGMLFSLVMGRWFRRRVGGVTGDMLGACGELAEAGLLFVCACVLSASG